MFEREINESDVKTMKKFLMYGASLVVGAVLLLNSITIIETGTVGIKSTFGKYSDEEILPGLSFKIPFVQRINVVNTKLQSANYNGEEDKDGINDGILNLANLSVLDKNNLSLQVDVTVQFQVVPEKASDLLTKFGNNFYMLAIHQIVRDVVRDSFSKYIAETIAQSRQEIGLTIDANLRKDLINIPQINIVNIALRDIKLPPSINKQIAEVQEAVQKERRLAIELIQEQRNQEIALVRAQTELNNATTRAKAVAESEIIAAEANAKIIITNAKATAESQFLLAQSQANANNLLSQSITEQLIKYQEVIKWNGILPQTVLGNNTGIMLNR